MNTPDWNAIADPQRRIESNSRMTRIIKLIQELPRDEQLIVGLTLALLLKPDALKGRL